MAVSVVDALVITFGIDTSDFEKSRKKIDAGLKKTKDGAGETAKYMESQGKRAAGFFSSIKNELLALAGVTLSVHGITSFVKNTTQGLMDLSIQSKALGISARSLDGWAKAATAAGSSAEKITGTLGNFQNAIQAFRSGDASSPVFKALALLNADTGTTFNPATQNAESMLRSVSVALQKERSPDRARYIAQMLDIDDASLQRMREGKFVSDADRFARGSGINDKDIENARRFNEQWTILQQKLEKTGYYIFNALSPYVDQFTKYLMQLADWVSTHPKEIKAAITSFFNAINQIADVASQAADAVGGWRNAILLLIGASVGGKLLSFLATFSRSLLGLSRIPLPPWMMGLLAYGTYAANDKENIQAAASGSWNYTKRNVGDALSSVGIKTDIGRRDVREIRKHPAWMDWLLGPGTVIRHGQSNGVVYGQNLQSDIPGGFSPPAGKGKALLDWMSGQFAQLEAQYGLPEGLLRSVATVESGGNQYAMSGKGAKGLFQFMPGTAKDLGLRGGDVFDPGKSAEAAARYFSYLMAQTGGDIESTLAAYNWGIGNVQRKGLGAAPLETQNYVPKVLAGIRSGASASQGAYFPPQLSASMVPNVSIGTVNVQSNAQNTERLTTDIVRNAQNRVRLLGFSSGQQ